MTDLEMIKDIALNQDWKKIEFINKGWSKDKKFCLTDKTGRKFLLRVSSIDEYDNKKMEFEKIAMVSKLGILMSMPIDFGTFDDGNKVYSLLSWVDGEDAEALLPKLSEEHQYKLGVKAGRILQKMHTIADKSDQKSWSERYKRKIKIVTEKYHNCSISIPNEEKIMRFIENNLSYLDGRPKTFQHGDYHVGNLLITSHGEIGVIDFNRCSFGDPWEEYDRFVFTWNVSIPFAIGQIHGYFDNNVPDKFFRLMSLYNATLIISSIPWAIPFGDAEIGTMLANAEKMLNCYDGFEKYIPVWYKDPTNLKI